MKQPNLYLGMSLAGWLAYSALATAQNESPAELTDTPVNAATTKSSLTLSYSQPLDLPVSSAETPPLYGPIDRTDTLWDIAGQYTQAPTTVQQTMVALYHLNPRAFVRGNINYLQRGVNLRIPTASQVQQRSAAEALSEFRRLTEQGSRNPYRGAIDTLPPASTTEPATTESVANDAVSQTGDDSQVDDDPQDKAALDTSTTPTDATTNNEAVLGDEVSEPEPNAIVTDDANDSNTTDSASELLKQQEELALVRMQLEVMGELREQVTLSNEQLVVLADNNQALRQRLAHLSEQVDALQQANSQKAAADSEPDTGSEAKAGKTWQQQLMQPLALWGLVPIILLLWLMGRRRRAKQAMPEPTSVPPEPTPTPLISTTADKDHEQVNTAPPTSAANTTQPQEQHHKVSDAVTPTAKPQAAPPASDIKVNDEDLDPAELEQDSALIAHLKGPYVSVEQLMADAEQGLGPDPDRQPNMNLGLDEYADVLGSSAQQGVDIDADEGGVGAQLDLARAYIEIDDAKSARDLLNIALKQGNEEQQQEAQKLLQRLS